MCPINERAGARVYIAEVDPICALQACMEEYEVVVIDEVIDKMNIFVTPTENKNIIKAHHMSKWKITLLLVTSDILITRSNMKH